MSPGSPMSIIHHEGGVLRVTVPLVERAQPRKIEVSTQAAAAVEA